MYNILYEWIILTSEKKNNTRPIYNVKKKSVVKININS